MTGLAPTLRMLAGNLRDALTVAGTLADSRDLLAPRFPVQAADLKGLSTADKLFFYGFLKMVESLQDQINARVFRGILAAGGVNMAGLLPRDIANRMEGLGVLDDAKAWREMTDFRNVIAHDYAPDPVRQAQLLNRAFDVTPYLIQTLERAKTLAAARFPEIAADLTADGKE